MERGARVGSACRNGEGGDETRYHDDDGGLPRDRWFESGFLQQRVQCEPDFLSLACSMIEAPAE
jgi:hypothetical protein